MNENYSGGFMERFCEWDKEGEFLALKCKDLRKTLEAEAALRGWEGYIFNVYLGRAPKDVQEKHYIRKGISEKDLQGASRCPD